MKKLRQLFCIHDFEYFANSPDWYIIIYKCPKCKKEKDVHRLDAENV